MTRLIPVGLLLVSAWACASHPPPAPVSVLGEPEDLAILAGEWEGEYSSVESGRRGRIRFNLEAGEGTAYGEVLMFPSTKGDGREPGNSSEGMETAGGPQSLLIRFVRVRPEDETVRGTLEPYRDPECDCVLSTSFVGQVKADRIEGTYTSHAGRDHPSRSGRWRVDRERE